MGNVREVSQLLRPSILDDFGLDASLRWLAEGFAERTRSQACATLRRLAAVSTAPSKRSFSASPRRRSPTLPVMPKRHNVEIELWGLSDVLRLTVADNGIGMELRHRTSGSGLVGMRARARAAGGYRSVCESRPGEGVPSTSCFP